MVDSTIKLINRAYPPFKLSTLLPSNLIFIRVVCSFRYEGFLIYQPKKLKSLYLFALISCNLNPTASLWTLFLLTSKPHHHTRPQANTRPGILSPSTPLISLNLAFSLKIDITMPIFIWLTFLTLRESDRGYKTPLLKLISPFELIFYGERTVEVLNMGNFG